MTPLIERSAFQGYTTGYQWRLYRQHRELGRWGAPEVATLTHQEHGQVGAA
jgi:hypothetical protein